MTSARTRTALLTRTAISGSLPSYVMVTADRRAQEAHRTAGIAQVAADSGAPGEEAKAAIYGRMAARYEHRRDALVQADVRAIGVVRRALEGIDLNTVSEGA